MLNVARYIINSQSAMLSERLRCPTGLRSVYGKCLTDPTPTFGVLEPLLLRCDEEALSEARHLRRKQDSGATVVTPLFQYHTNQCFPPADNSDSENKPKAVDVRKKLCQYSLRNVGRLRTGREKTNYHSHVSERARTRATRLRY
jgi:hypothetical protein